LLAAGLLLTTLLHPLLLLYKTREFSGKLNEALFREFIYSFYE